MSGLALVLIAYITIVAISPKSLGRWMAEVRRGYDAQIKNPK